MRRYEFILISEECLPRFLQFTFPAEVPLEGLYRCFGVQVRPKSLTFPSRPSPKRAERTSPVQVNRRRYPRIRDGYDVANPDAVGANPA